MRTAETVLDNLLAKPHPCQGVCDPPVQNLEPTLILCSSCWHKVPGPARRRVYAATRASRLRQDEDTLGWLRRTQLAAIESLKNRAPRPSDSLQFSDEAARR